MNEELQPHTQKVQPGFFDGNPRTMFVFGLVSGLALALLVNNFTGVSFAANQGGREPIAVTPPANPGTAPTGELAAVQPDEHIRGNLEKAKVLVIEYSDFQCPYCAQHHPSLQQMVDDYGDDVAWVYRHFPLTSIHPEAEPSANAAECAAEQGKFWEFADALIENQSGLGDEYYAELAADLGLNAKKFDDCYASKKYQAVIDADVQSGEAAGVTGTPATFINGQLVSGAVPYSTLQQIIDAELGG